MQDSNEYQWVAKSFSGEWKKGVNSGGIFILLHFYLDSVCIRTEPPKIRKFKFTTNLTKLNKKITKQTTNALYRYLYLQVTETLNNFKDDIANSRTLGFVQDLDYLQSRGLAKGASLDNAIGIDKDIILNHEGLRHDNEFVRHKMLDLMGDLYTTGTHFIGKIDGYKTSHNLNNQFLRKIFSDPYAYTFVDTIL